MRSGSSATGNNSFNSLVGTGSNKHVVGLDVVISLFSSSCPIVVKQLSFSLGAINEAEVLDAVESTFVIVFLILSILSVNKCVCPLQMWMSVCPQCVEFTASALTHLAVSPASVLQGFTHIRTAPVQVSDVSCCC